MRIKTVFSSNSQCCHVWAQQKQNEGRGSHIFFRDNMIFSYGEHYLAAKLHVVNYGKPFALVNSHKYSVSTGRHLSLIHGALRGKMPAFDVAKPNDIKAAIKELDGKAKSAHLAEIKRLKITSRDDVDYCLRRILGAYGHANELRRLCGRKDIKVDAKTYAEVEKHLNNRLIRHQELNTPEALARKAVDRKKREAVREQKEIKRLAEDIRRFRAGEIAGVNGLSQDLLRVQGDFVRTSRQATVPLREAVVLFKALSNGHDIVGHKVGHFEVERVTDIANDKVIKVGCHLILLSEAKAVLEGVKTN